MFELSKIEPVSEHQTLEQLLKEAMKYGRIFLHQHQDGDFSFNIDFMAAEGCHLQAKSGFGCKTIKGAIILAIENAEKIRSQFK